MWSLFRPQIRVNIEIREDNKTRVIRLINNNVVESFYKFTDFLYIPRPETLTLWEKLIKFINGNFTIDIIRDKKDIYIIHSIPSGKVTTVKRQVSTLDIYSYLAIMELIVLSDRESDMNTN